MTKEEQKQLIMRASAQSATAWLVISIGNEFLEESMETIDKAMLKIPNYKFRANNYIKAFDMLHREMKEILEHIETAQSDFARCYNELKVFINEYLVEGTTEDNWNWKQRYLFAMSKINLAQQLYDESFDEADRLTEKKNDEIRRLMAEVEQLKAEVQRLTDKPADKPADKKKKQFTQTIHLQ